MFYFGCCIRFTHVLQVYVSDVLSVAYLCCIQVFHVAHLSCSSENQGTWGVMVARRGHLGMGRDELGADGRGALEASCCGATGAGCACERGANGLESRQTRWAAHARRVIRTRKPCDRARCACGAGKKISE